ncbi:MAG: RNase P modulator RnpM, partial [Candidatus Fimimonas sp.]
MKERKIPERMCISCRQMKPKNQLLRLVLTENGAQVDLTGKVNGRGVYLCKCQECLQKMRKNKGLEKNYGFSLTEELY